MHIVTRNVVNLLTSTREDKVSYNITIIHLRVAGQKYAMLEIKATMSQLLRNYKLLPGTTPLDITNEIVLKSTTGVNITLEARGKT
jgi:hypothetical protein